MENNALTLPQSIEQEQAVLGSVIIQPDKYYELEGLLQADDFYVHRNGWVWQAFVELSKSKTPIDILTLTDEIDRRGHLAELGGAAYLTKLLNSAPSSSNALAYAKTVKDTSIRRKLIIAAQKALGHAENESISALEAVENVQRELSNLQVGASDTDIETLADVIRQYDYDRENGKNVSVFKTKTREINQILGGGLWSERVCLLAGEAKLGKTLIAWRIIGEIAGNGTACLFISQEMSKRDLATRAISAIGKIPEERLQLGNIGGFEAQYDDALAALENLPVWISQKSRWALDPLRAEILKQKRENGVQVVLIDHVRLLANNPDMPKAAAYEQLEWKTLEIKRIAKDAGVAILAIYTLNAAGELSGGASPQYNVDLALKLMPDKEWQEDTRNPNKGSAVDGYLWLAEEYRRYGAYESAIQFKKDPSYPLILDAFTPRGMP